MLDLCLQEIFFLVVVVTDCIQYSKIVHTALVCTEGMNVCENVVLDVSVFYARLLGIFFLHLLRYGLEKS